MGSTLIVRTYRHGPYNRRLTLAGEISSAEPGARQVCLWWLGQAGFVIRSADTTLVIDACLTLHPNHKRRYPPPLRPDELVAVDAVMGTHDHDDHIDPGTFAAVMRTSPGAVAVVPAPVVVPGIDVDRVTPALVDQVLYIKGAEVIPFPAVHARHPRDGYGFHADQEGHHPFVGYLIRLAGVAIYHAGDTLLYDGLGERLAGANLDALLAPINGSSQSREKRGIVGNMGLAEVAVLAARCRARVTIPMHYDLFADNSADPGELVQYVSQHHPDLNVVVMARGRRYDLSAAPA
jgi:L-ascorbate metabolism protein UlaG (beta-lactamase superfamily)